MADEATTDVENPEPQEGAVEKLANQLSVPQEDVENAIPDGDDGDKFDPDKALEKIRKLNSEAANLRKRLREAEPKAASADEAASRLKALEAENLRLRVGARHGLPDAIVDRLKGDTEEEILADAQALLEVMSPKRPPTTRPSERLRSTGPAGQDVEETDLDKLGARMFRH